jgi:hypothetical protein
MIAECGGRWGSNSIASSAEPAGAAIGPAERRIMGAVSAIILYENSLACVAKGGIRSSEAQRKTGFEASSGSDCAARLASSAGLSASNWSNFICLQAPFDGSLRSGG